MLATSNTSLKMSLTGPSGTIQNVHIYEDSYGTATPPSTHFPAGRELTLTITARGNNTGTYSFRLFDLATATPETIPATGLVVSDTLNPAAATNSYFFAGAAGEQLYFNAADSTN